MEQESSLFARMKRRMQGFSVNSKGQPTISAEVLKSTWAFNGVELAALRNLAAAFTSRYFRENEVRAACDAHDAREPRVRGREERSARGSRSFVAVARLPHLSPLAHPLRSSKGDSPRQRSCARQAIFYEGEDADTLFVLLRGQVVESSASPNASDGVALEESGGGGGDNGMEPSSSGAGDGGGGAITHGEQSATRPVRNRRIRSR